MLTALLSQHTFLLDACRNPQWKFLSTDAQNKVKMLTEKRMSFCLSLLRSHSWDNREENCLTRELHTVSLKETTTGHSTHRQTHSHTHTHTTRLTAQRANLQPHYAMLLLWPIPFHPVNHEGCQFSSSISHFHSTKSLLCPAPPRHSATDPVCY